MSERPILPGTRRLRSDLRQQLARRGSFHSGPSHQNATECGYCGKIGHHEEECRKKMREAASTSRQLTNYAHNSDYEEYTGMYGHNSDYKDRGGMYARNSDRGGMFMRKHRGNSNSALKPEDVWFVDSRASNHMTSHKEWFLELREPERPSYVET